MPLNHQNKWEAPDVSGAKNGIEAQLLTIQDKLDSWNCFTQELQVPAELLPAITSGRYQLLALAQPRPLTADQCKTLYDLIGGLLETNAALREHAQLIGELTAQLRGAVHSAVVAGDRLRAFANFQSPVSEDDS